MNKTLLICVIIFTPIVFFGCANLTEVKTSDVVAIENEYVPNSSVFIYVNSSEETLENLYKEFARYTRAEAQYRLFGDAKKTADGKTTLTIEYFLNKTEALIALLRQESTDGLVYGEKTMILGGETEKNKNTRLVNVTLIPVKLLK